MPTKEYDDATCIIVVMYKEFILGLIVDAVKETAIIPEDSISAPPSAKLNHANYYVRNIGRFNGQIKLLLDLEKFLAQD
jgi:purine-binding chemotaxis protein CheW